MPPSRSTPDWTVAVDDALCERLRCCSSCGQARPVHVGLHLLDGLAIATSVCRRCHQADPPQVVLGERLRQRYDPARWESQRPT